MLTKYFYEGPVASTAESYREQLDFARTMAFMLGGALVVMLGVFLWSALTLFPLGDTHPAFAAVIVLIKAVAAAIILADALALVTAVRSWRVMAIRVGRAR